MFHIHFELIFFFKQGIYATYTPSRQPLLFFFFITSVGARPGGGIHPAFLSPLIRMFAMAYIHPPPRNLSPYLPGVYSRTRLSTFKERACETRPYIQKKKAIPLSQIRGPPCRAADFESMRRWEQALKLRG